LLRVSSSEEEWVVVIKPNIIACQIAVSDPRIRKLINEALIQDPFILDKSIEAQLRYLITNPLHEVARDPSPSGRPLSLSMG